MTKLKILVCTHKKVTIRNNDVYMPVHAGKAISNIDLAIQGDDTGENISEKNKQYCELTVLFWAWKNLKCTDYIGFCHYRRYFDIDESKLRNIEKMMDGKDIILMKHITDHWSVAHGFEHNVCSEDLYILLMVIEKLYPEYKSVSLSFFYNSNKFFPCQMFICKWTLFDNYSKFLFSILFEAEKYIKVSEYARIKRSLAYMGEMLLSIYCLYNNLKIEECPIIMTESCVENKWKKKLSIIRNNFVFFLMHPRNIKKIDHGNSALIAGLRADNMIP